MLQIQESSHSTLLLAPMLTTPSVHPQPSSSSSSRTTRVVEQLQDTLDSLQKDLILTRAQLEAARQSKAQAELDAHTYVESNKQYRVEVQGLMKVLESKQQLLDSTKKSSMAMEAQVKKLRDEALASRKKHDELRRREQVLERDRNAAVAEKEQTARQQIVLKEVVQSLSTRYDREVAQLLSDLDEVRGKVNSMADKSTKMARVIEERTRTVETERKQLIEHMQAMRIEMHNNLRQFVNEIREQAGPLFETMNQSAQGQKDFEYQVLKCRGEVNGLVARIRAYTAEAYGSAN